jgi:hypothetical protein
MPANRTDVGSCCERGPVARRGHSYPGYRAAAQRRGVLLVRLGHEHPGHECPAGRFRSQGDRAGCSAVAPGDLRRRGNGRAWDAPPRRHCRLLRRRPRMAARSGSRVTKLASSRSRPPAGPGTHCCNPPLWTLPRVPRRTPGISCSIWIPRRDRGGLLPLNIDDGNHRAGYAAPQFMPLPGAGGGSRVGGAGCPNLSVSRGCSTRRA